MQHTQATTTDRTVFHPVADDSPERYQALALSPQELDAIKAIDKASVTYHFTQGAKP